MKEYCRQQLESNYNDANSHIESLIEKPNEDISPLLKFYNELAANTKFRMPLKSLLEFDLKMFRKHLTRIKKAH